MPASQQKRARAESTISPSPDSTRWIAEAMTEATAGAERMTAERETALFRGLYASNLSLARLTERGLGESSAARALQQRRDQLVDVLFNANLGLVYQMRRRFDLRWTDDDECRSAGMWALYQAVLGFDPWRGIRFSTYACNAIGNAYGHVLKHATTRRRILQNYVMRHPERLEQIVAYQREDDLAVAHDRLHEVLREESDVLTELERTIIRRRFFDSGGERKPTLAAIGKIVKLSKERVRQIQIRALAKLRNAFDENVISSALGN